MKVIGLTGGIGSGKSTVSDYLKEKGCHIIDADKISKKLTEKGGVALEAIRRAFGEEVFLNDGALNRKKLAEIVFTDKDKLEVLQKITTGKVIEQITEEINTLRKENFNGIVIVDAPLLFECNMQELTDENWLVTADLQVRIERVIKRDQLTAERIMERMNNQMSDDQKTALADRIIDNTGDLKKLYIQIDNLIERVNEG